MMLSPNLSRKNESGFAIGPILLIIALLGILAAAIAASSGGGTSSTASEGNTAKASGLIQAGQNLKDGMDRLIGSNHVDFNLIVINSNNTTSAADLYSPSGGGITPPSVTLAVDPVNNTWLFPTAIMPGLGTGETSSKPDRLAMLQITQGVCDEVNKRAGTLDTTVANYDAGAIGDPYNVDNDLGNLTGSNVWPTALTGKLVGCIFDTSTNTYWFYQMLAIQ